MSDSRAVLSVANTGATVPAAAVDRLFQPFQRLAADRTSYGEGLGLGLSIVQAIADAHGASIAARPRPGGGLLVEVTFPKAHITRPLQQPPARLGTHPPVAALTGNSSPPMRHGSTAAPQQ
jgi:signal transduction histidine kinase